MPQMFTPEEIQALVEAGELKQADLQLMDKADAQVAFSMLDKAGKIEVMGPGDVGIGMGFPMGKLGTALQGASGGLLDGAKKLWNKGGNQVTGALGGAAAGALGGHPVAGAMIGRELTKGLRFKGPQLTPPNPAPQAPPPSAPIPPSVFRRSALHPADGQIDDEILEQVKRGVQNDFRGPVGFQKATRPDGGGLSSKPKLRQPNISTKRTTDDVREQVTGSSRKNWEDPRGHSDLPGDDQVDSVREKIRATLDKKKAKRRKP